MKKILFTICFVFVFLFLQNISNADSRILNNGNGSMWDNSNYIDSNFWSSNPTSDDIIKAIYGTNENPQTAYTKNRENWSFVNCTGLQVAHTNDIPEYLSGNTIYVIDEEKITVNGTIHLNQCSTIISKNPNGTTFTSQTAIEDSKGLLYIQQKNVVLDNLQIDGSKEGVWSEENRNYNGISLLLSSENTLHNIETYRNRYNGIYISRSENNDAVSIVSHENTNGISIYLSTGNSVLYSISYNNLLGTKISSSIENNIKGLKTYNNQQDGIEINGSSKNIIQDSEIYNNQGNGVVIKEDSSENVLNNLMIYNNYEYGTVNYTSNKTTINNSQIYNNLDGVIIYSGTNNIINNSQVYNNLHGIKIIGGSGMILNNILSFNNEYGIWIENSQSNNYYGSLNVFDNQNENIVGQDQILQGDNTELSHLDWQEGEINTGYKTSWNFVSNPLNQDNIYMINRGNNIENIWTNTRIESMGNKSEYFGKETINYSYGKNVLKQKQPVSYIESSIENTLTFDEELFIASNVKYIEADTINLPETTTGNTINILATAFSNADISHYNIYGDILQNISGNNIDTQSEIELNPMSYTGNDNIKKVVIQTYSPQNYFATHFQKNIELLPNSTKINLDEIQNIIESDLPLQILGSTSTGAFFTTTGTIQIKSSNTHELILSVSGLTIIATGEDRDGIIQGPTKTEFTGQANIVNGYLHNPLLTYQIGNERTSLQLSGQVANIKIFVGEQYNDKKIKIFKSSDGGLTYIFVGEYIVGSGYIEFTTDGFSLFTIYVEKSNKKIASIGGGGSSMEKDNCSLQNNLPCANEDGIDYSDSFYDKTCCISKSTEIKVCEITNSSYSQEINSAFSWAYENNITNKCPIGEALLDDNITRAELAKMVSMFAINFLGYTINDNSNRCNEFDDINSLTQDLKEFVKISCKLNIMGLNSDGKTAMKSFMPNENIDRAQFGTILSRMIYKDKNNIKSGEEITHKWYEKHLDALKKDDIMTKIENPYILEKRSWVMLMLHRLSKK